MWYFTKESVSFNEPRIIIIQIEVLLSVDSSHNLVTYTGHGIDLWTTTMTYDRTKYTRARTWDTRGHTTKSEGGQTLGRVSIQSVVGDSHWSGISYTSGQRLEKQSNITWVAFLSFDFSFARKLLSTMYLIDTHERIEQTHTIYCRRENTYPPVINITCSLP